MLVTFNKVAQRPYNEPKIESASLVGLTRNELDTIYYALEEYKKNLKTTSESEGAKKISNGLEDEMFCYGQMSQCATIQYYIRWDGLNKDEIEWMDFD